MNLHLIIDASHAPPKKMAYNKEHSFSSKILIKKKLWKWPFSCAKIPLKFNQRIMQKKKKMPFSIASLDSTKSQAKKVLDHKRVKKNRVNTIDKLRASQWAHFLNILSAHQFTT